MKIARIIIAEDEPMVARLIAISLQELGHEVVATTPFAHEAVDLAERLRPDLVLMDIGLADGFSGVEAAQLLRQKFAIPSVFITGQVDRAIVQTAKSAEPLGYIVKPFEEFELQTALETALRLCAVEKRLAQFSRAVEQSPASIVITGLGGSIEFVNPRFTEVTGYTAAEAIGQNPRILKSGIHSVDHYRELWTAIGAGREWRGEFCNRKKSGELFWEMASISPIRDDVGRITHFVAIKEDITTRKQAEDRSAQSRIQLEYTNAQLTAAVARERELAVAADVANRAKSTFLTSMSHELRTPLNVINGVAATLAEQEADGDRKRALNLIQESGESLLGLIEEILDYSGFQAGKARLESKPFNVAALISRVVQLATERIRSHRIGFTWTIDGCVPAEVVGDDRRLSQILLNLLLNAIKHTDRGGVHLGVSARSRSAGTCSLSFSVCDTGPGVAPEDRGRLFQPFTEIGGAPDRLASGTGLGLVIARSYASLMGGDIVVRSQPGRGSVFRCTVVVGRTQGSAGAIASLAPAELRSHRLLVVARDSRQRRLLSAAARSWNLTASVCTEAGDAAAALRLPEPFTLAILDPEAVRDPSTDLARWLAPGAPGYNVPVAWLHRFDSTPSPRTAAASLFLSHPLDVTELARGLTDLVTRSAGPAPVTAARLAGRLPLRILAADDIRTNREVLRGIMAHLGYQIETVENGTEVLACLERQMFDLVLLDVQMPVMDGLTAAREICRRQPDSALRPKIAAVTANALPGDREKCIEAGMDDYMSKPVLPRHVEACLHRLFKKGEGSAVSNGPAMPVPPDPTAPPLVDSAQFETILPGLTPAEAAETLAELHNAARDDFQRIWPQVVVACKDHDALQLAELTHGLKGCFLTLGWTRIARRSIEVLGEARKCRFAAWDTFPSELKDLFAASTAAMSEAVAAVARGKAAAGSPETAVAAGGHAPGRSPDAENPLCPVAEVAGSGPASSSPASSGTLPRENPTPVANERAD